MDFSQALLEAKNGKAIRRSGWNAADQFVYHVPASEYEVKTSVAKNYFGHKQNADEGDFIAVPYTAYMAIKTVQDTVAPWLASQTDLLAEDWEVVEV